MKQSAFVQIGLSPSDAIAFAGQEFTQKPQEMHDAFLTIDAKRPGE